MNTKKIASAATKATNQTSYNRILPTHVHRLNSIGTMFEPICLVSPLDVEV